MPRIGLKTDKVSLQSYSKSWTREFEHEKHRLKNLLSKEVIEIQHIGSTAIKGIWAKPMIDLVLGVKSVKSTKNKIINKLKAPRYVLRKFRNPNQHLLFSKISKGHTTHHLHVVRYKGVVWKNIVNFRDYLNLHPRYAKSYEILKKKLAKKFPDSRRKYTLAKSKFVKDILIRVHNKNA